MNNTGEDQFEEFRMKLKSAAKLKLDIERKAYDARYREQSLNKQLVMIKAEIEFLKDQLEDIGNQIAHVKHQISMIEICSSSEKSKIDGHLTNLQVHMKGFQHIFEKERDLFDIRIKETQNKKAEEEEVHRQKEREIAEKNEQEGREAVPVEAECEALERECAVLKKRNNAIMLQLRRKLLETENARRELAKRNS